MFTVKYMELILIKPTVIIGIIKEIRRSKRRGRRT